VFVIFVNGMRMLELFVLVILLFPIFLFAQPYYSIYLETKSSTEYLKEDISDSNISENNFFIRQYSSNLYSLYSQKSDSKELLEIDLKKYTNIFEHAYIEKIESPFKLLNLVSIQPSNKSLLKNITNKKYYNLSTQLKPTKSSEVLDILYELKYEKESLVSHITLINKSDIFFTNLIFYRDKKVLYKNRKLKSKEKKSFQFLQQNALNYHLIFNVGQQIFELSLTNIINSREQITVYFLLGKTDIYNYSKEKLKIIKQKIYNSDNNYLVCIKASSDSMPIKKAHYKNNIDLSYFRALEVKKELEIKGL